MKKLLAGILGAALITAGLVSASSAPSTAAPYPGTVKTRTIAVGIATPVPRQAKVYVKVTSYGSGAPKGHLEFTFVHKTSGKAYGFSRRYDGAQQYKFNDLRPGTYAVVVTFIPPDDSVFKASSAKTRCKVRK
ncbi:hypothetical protein [Nocardioides aquiterrae]|uniref:Carboxypeptidase regulatory-like domain-containing protein n=1 Tax=Nocardioides aquiterrae TaxID=203799 RepID=A0ABN1UF26_9ACTN